MGGRWSPGYAATKHALAGLTKAYADDFAEYNIQINGIAPGYYVSEMTAIIYNNPKIKELIKGVYRLNAGEGHRILWAQWCSSPVPLQIMSMDNY